MEVYAIVTAEPTFTNQCVVTHTDENGNVYRCINKVRYKIITDRNEIIDICEYHKQLNYPDLNA